MEVAYIEAADKQALWEAYLTASHNQARADHALALYALSVYCTAG